MIGITIYITFKLSQREVLNNHYHEPLTGAAQHAPHAPRGRANPATLNGAVTMDYYIMDFVRNLKKM